MTRCLQALVLRQFETARAQQYTTAQVQRWLLLLCETTKCLRRDQYQAVVPRAVVHLIRRLEAGPVGPRPLRSAAVRCAAGSGG